MHLSRHNSVALLVGTLLLVSLWGCGDDSTAPSTRVDLTTEQATDWSQSALEMVNTMVAQVPDIAAGTMTTLGTDKAAGEPEWDAAQMAWVYGAEFSLDDGEGSSMTLAAQFWVQYRNAEGPLQSALGATEVEFRASETMTADSVADGANSHVDYAMGTTMTIGYGDGVYLVDGTGSATVDARQTQGGRTEQVAFAMNWGVDLSQTPEGCPAGAAWVELDPWRMDAVYDGQGGVAWTLIGPNATVSDNETIICGGGPL